MSKKHAIDLFTEARMLRSKPSKVPFGQNMKLSKNKGEMLKDPMTYMRLLRKLMYLTLPRPTLSYSV